MAAQDARWRLSANAAEAFAIFMIWLRPNGTASWTAGAPGGVGRGAVTDVSMGHVSRVWHVHGTTSCHTRCLDVYHEIRCKMVGRARDVCAYLVPRAVARQRGHGRRSDVATR